MQEEAAEKIDAGLRRRWQADDAIDSCRLPSPNRRFWQFRRAAHTVMNASAAITILKPAKSANTTDLKAREDGRRGS
jgi:hypothetical protein